MAALSNFTPIVCVVGFHHARGPEIESWFGTKDSTDPAIDNDWSFLPFMALADGIHASNEDFSYFTLRRKATELSSSTSVFGISCTRQLDSDELIDRPADVTRSSVQKAVVAIADSPRCFGQLREKLRMVTGAWFAQKDFTDVNILKRFQESITTSLQNTQDEQYLGLSLRELIYEYKYQTLVLFKCCLLQPKMLFFGTRCERLCMIQFALISLIPGLLRSLEDAAEPEFDSYAKGVQMSTSLKTSDRNSLLAYMGLPLQLFGKGSLFCPYIPLQQLDVLADFGTKSYIVGSTNALLLQNKDRYSDILINLDEQTINISSTSLRTALGLSAADRRWIDFLSQTVVETWDESNPSRPKTMGFMGSEEFIRLQFEEYLLALLSSTKYHLYLQTPNHTPVASIEGDPTTDFNDQWIHAWQQTSSFTLFNKITDSHIFDVVEPRHPTAGTLTIEDVQRRLTQQIQTLHLDERLATGKEALNKHLATGQKKLSTAFANLWADIEAMREAQRKPQAEVETVSSGTEETASRPWTPAQGNSPPTAAKGIAARTPDLTAAQASVQAAGQKAGVYFQSWGAWAAERKSNWGKKTGESENAVPGQTDAGKSTQAKANEEAGRSGPGKLNRWSSLGSFSSLGSGGGIKEEKGVDGIGRLDAFTAPSGKSTVGL